MTDTTTTTKAVDNGKSLNVAAFVKASRSDSKAVATKVAIIGRAVQGGALLAKVAQTLTEALEADGQIVPASFVQAVGHYAKAAKVVLAAGMTLTAGPEVLHAAYSTCTGKVKADVRDQLAAQVAEVEESSRAETFVNGARELLANARSAKAATPSNVAPTKATPEADDENDDEGELGASMVDDARKLIKQLTAIMANATPDDADAIRALADGAGLTAALMGE